MADPHDGEPLMRTEAGDDLAEVPAGYPAWGDTFAPRPPPPVYPATALHRTTLAVLAHLVVGAVLVAGGMTWLLIAGRRTGQVIGWSTALMVFGGHWFWAARSWVEADPADPALVIHNPWRTYRSPWPEVWKVQTLTAISDWEHQPCSVVITVQLPPRLRLVEGGRIWDTTRVRKITCHGLIVGRRTHAEGMAAAIRLAKEQAPAAAADRHRRVYGGG